jgi:hypothetical protein
VVVGVLLGIGDLDLDGDVLPGVGGEGEEQEDRGPAAQGSVQVYLAEFSSSMRISRVTSSPSAVVPEHS